MEKRKIQAVHDDDLNSLLLELGFRQELENNEFKCIICHEIAPLEALFALFPNNNRMSIVCNKSECVKTLLSHGDALDVGNE